MKPLHNYLTILFRKYLQSFYHYLKDRNAFNTPHIIYQKDFSIYKTNLL